MVTASDTTARELLMTARRLADQPAIDTIGLWPRGSVLLARQSLEVALKTYWIANVPGVEQSPMRTQLKCLGYSLSNDSLGNRAYDVWRLLSRASCYQPDNPTLTTHELFDWFDTVQEVIDATEGPWWARSAAKASAKNRGIHR